LW
ncbi:putative membrane protein, partial [Vibrio parahaemolyticus AQ3810]|jgi:hypothetical protein